jgi:hypothetical protein
MNAAFGKQARTLGTSMSWYRPAWRASMESSCAEKRETAGNTARVLEPTCSVMRLVLLTLVRPSQSKSGPLSRTKVKSLPGKGETGEQMAPEVWSIPEENADVGDDWRLGRGQQGAVLLEVGLCIHQTRQSLCSQCMDEQTRFKGREAAQTLKASLSSGSSSSQVTCASESFADRA